MDGARILQRGGDATGRVSITEVVVQAGAGVGAQPSVNASPAALFVAVVVIAPVVGLPCVECGREIESGYDYYHGFCSPCGERRNWMRLPHESRKSRIARARFDDHSGRKEVQPDIRLDQDQIHAEFSMPHRFGLDDD